MPMTLRNGRILWDASNSMRSHTATASVRRGKSRYASHNKWSRSRCGNQAPLCTVDFGRSVNVILALGTVFFLSILVGVLAAFCWYISMGNAGSAHTAFWNSCMVMVTLWRGSNAKQGELCNAKHRLSGFKTAAAMIPLVNQLEKHSVQSISNAIFKFRERSLVGEAESDWEALAGLQRNCALRRETRRRAGPKTDYTLPENAQDGETIINIPRIMSLSSLNAPEYIREACKVPQDTGNSIFNWFIKSNSFRPCSADELLAFSVVVEKHLQRQALREFMETKAGREFERANATSLPSLPYCLVNSNRKNAPFFTSRQREAVKYLTHINTESVDTLVTTLKNIIQRVAGVRTTEKEKDEAHRGVAAALQTIGIDCDEEQLNLDIKSAISVVYSKRISDGPKNGAVLPIAASEAGHDTYPWSTPARLAPDFDGKGFKWTKEAISVSAPVVSVKGDELNNIHLLHRFGFAARSNPWGSVFFFRKNTIGNAAVASPVGEGTAAGQIRPLFTILEAEENLPEWLRKQKTIRRYGLESFHYRAGDTQTPHAGAGRATQIPEKEKREKRENSTIECNYKTLFTSKTFGYGVFSIRHHGPVGGFQKDEYWCIRAMLADVPSDTLASTNGKSLSPHAAAEVKAADFFINTCGRQLEKLTKAASLLYTSPDRGGRLNTGESSSGAQRARSTREEGESLFFEETEEEYTEQSQEVSRLMTAAINFDQALVQRCISYFTQVRNNAISALPA